MSIDGRDEALSGGGPDSDEPASRQVPNQGGPAGETASGTGTGPGPEHTGSVPSQRENADSTTPDTTTSDTTLASASLADELLSSSEVPVSDPELIDRMRTGDDSAYEELYRRHAEAVRRYARTCCRDEHTADDLTSEVFAGMLQAVRGGAGPEHAVRAYLLTSVRRVAASWMKADKREQLVEDFALFAAQASRSSEVSDDDTLDLGADVMAMHEAERSLVMQAFRSLSEEWQAVLWHTEVEDDPLSEVAPLFGHTSPNATAQLASRAREGLKQAYLQAHVSVSLATDDECARYADRLGTYARGRLRTRAERGLRKHLEECAKCRLAAGQINELAGGIPALVPVAVIGWFGAAGYAKAGLLFGGSAAAGAGAGAAAGGASGGAASEGLGAPAKAGIAAGVVLAASVAVALALTGAPKPEAKAAPEPPATQPAEPQKPSPEPKPESPQPKPPTAPDEPTPTPKPESPAPKPPPQPAPTPTPTPTPTTTPTPTPTPTPPTSPAPSPPAEAPEPEPTCEEAIPTWAQGDPPQRPCRPTAPGQARAAERQPDHARGR